VRWGYNGTYSWFTNIKNMNHEVKSGFLGYSSTNHVETYGYPNQQIYRYRSVSTDPNVFTRPDSVQVFDYPNDTNSGVNFNSWFVNDMITLTRQVTLNAGVRFDRYSSWLPEQGNPGTGPFAEENLYPENRHFPVYNAWSPRLSLIYSWSMWSSKDRPAATTGCACSICACRRPSSRASTRSRACSMSST
jgi:outer membrane receptor protein involved in Fe transport